MSVNISASFTKEDKPLNGLEAIAEALADETLANEEYVIVGKVKPKFVKFDAEEGTRTPTVRPVHIEVLTGERAFTALRLLKEQHGERTVRQAPADTGNELFDREQAVSPDAWNPAVAAAAEELGSVKQPDEWLDDAVSKPKPFSPGDRPDFTPPPAAADEDAGQGE